MDQKRPIRILVNILGIVVCVIALVVMLLAALPGFTLGRCLIADNGSVMLVDGNSPIVLSNQTGSEKLFDGLATGDKILVAHDGVDDSYPGGTGAYFVMKLGSGGVSDIPENVIDQLRELGWLEKDDSGETARDPEPVEDYETVTANCGYANMTLKIPEGWEYSVEAYTEQSAGADGCGINFYPAGQTVGSITLLYYDAWGVCGTGLEQKTAFLGDYEAWVGTYDGHELWDFISVKNMPGNYVFLNTGAESWWAEYGDEAMWIIENAILAEGIMTEEQAVFRAIEVVEELGSYEAGYTSFDSSDGVWKVELYALDDVCTDGTAYVYPDGVTHIEGIVWDD